MASLAPLAATHRKPHLCSTETIDARCSLHAKQQETVADSPTPCLACPKVAPLSREEHAEIMRQTDFVIPVKDVGAFLRAVVEAVATIYTPRRIVFIAETDVLDALNKLASAWDLPPTTRFAFVYEETFFHGLAESSSLPASVWTKEGLRARFDAYQNANTRTGCAPREFGWWYQQLLKLGVPEGVPDISKFYVVWDSDLVPLRPWDLFVRDTKSGEPLPCIAILQNSSKAPFIFAEYLRAVAMLNVHADDDESSPLRGSTPDGGGTFICHHMVFSCTTLGIFKRLIESGTESGEGCRPLLWPLQIIDLSRHLLRFSEYLTYASFAVSRGSLAFHRHSCFGGGLRVRHGGGNVFRDLKMFVGGEDNVYRDGITFFQTREFALTLCDGKSDSKLSTGCSNDTGPTYLQLDHVYASMQIGAQRRFPMLPNILCQPHEESEGLETSTSAPAEQYSAVYCLGPACDSNPKKQVTQYRKLAERMQYWWRVFDRIGAIFVHVPKNAGTSVEVCLSGKHTLCSQHFTAHELKAQHPKRWRELPTFAIFRDPVERFISAYNYLFNGGNGGLSDSFASKMLQAISFDDFLDELYIASGQQYHVRDDCIHDAASHKDASVYDSYEVTVKPSWKALPIHFWPQSTFLCDHETGDVMVDHLFHIKQLNDGILDLMQLVAPSFPSFLGTPVMSRQPNTVSNLLTIDVAHINARQRSKIESVYAKDYKLIMNLKKVSPHIHTDQDRA